MIYLYDSTETDFRYNGKPLPTAYDVTVSNTLNSEYYVMGKYPLDKDKVYKEIVEDRIIKVHTMDGMEPFRIVSVNKQELYIEFEAWPLFYADMRNKLVKPLNLKGVSGQTALSSFKNNLLIDTPFDFYSDITDNHDYHTQDENERENNPKQLYNALDVFKTIVNRWGGELWIRGYDIRVNKRIGTDTESMLYEKKNITEFVDTTNIEGIVTRLHGKSEWQDERQEGEEEGQKHSIEVTVDSPLINDYSGVVFEKQFTNNDIRTEQELKNWLNLKFTTENIDKPQRTIEVGTNVIDGIKIGFADTLILKYIKHDTDVRIKVVGYEYDGFANELKHVVLGQPKNTSSSTIGNTITDLVNNVVEPVDRKTTIAMSSADGKSTVFHGMVDPNTLNLNAKENDTYFRTNGSEKEIWRFTGTLWELIMDTSETTKNADAIAEQQQDIDDARQVADEAVERINTDVADKFTSIDSVIDDLNYITMNAEQNAQQAITDASNAYGLAQTSISEAQTAQANSLTALGKADNALDGVSSLNVRVDDVEGELELKADNTFMNEDGTLTTLSNAITFNAHRFSSDMSRIESRVESLAGEINLVVLRDAIKGTRLMGGEVYPNTTPYSQSNTMREMINVTPGEKLAISKETPSSGYNYFTINFYDENYVYKSLLHTQSNQQVITIAPGIYKMWVAYPAGSKPQIVRGTQFLPYRPSIADQMTTDEMVLFRNEYDEYADRTERRLSAIDSTGGSLDVLNNRITTEAGLVRTDMTALIDTKVSDDDFSEFYQNEYLETAQEVSRKISLSDIKIGGRNLLKNTSPNEVTNLTERQYFLASPLSVGYYKVSFEAKASVPTDASVYINDNTGQNRVRQRSQPRVSLTTGFKRFEVEIEIYEADSVSIDNISLRVRSADINITDKFMKLEKGNVATGWERAPEDEDAKIAYIETEWTQTFEDFEFTVSDNQGKVNTQLQTLENSLSAINDPTTGRLTIAEQSLNGFRNEVYNADGSSKITQLATGLSSVVSNFKNLLPDSEKRVGGIGSGALIGGEPGSLVYQNIPVKPNTTYSLRYVAYVNSPTLVVLTFSDFASNIQTHNQAYANGNRIREFKLASTQSFTTSPNERYIAISTGNSRENNRENYVDYRNLQLEEGASTNWTGAHALNSYASQISQLANNINLRVSKGDLLSQINIEAGRTLIQSDKLLLDANNVVFTGKAWIPSAVIGDIEADKITSGRLDAGQITVVNLDFDTAVGSKTSFVQSAWNTINSNLVITGNSLVYTHSEGRQTLMSADGLTFIDDGRNYHTNYLYDIYTITGLQHQPNSPYWYQLPDVYKNKDFKALAVFSDAYGVTNDPSYDELATLRIVTYVDRPNIDRKNGRVPIYGYHRVRRLSDGRITNHAIQVQLLVQY